MKIILFTILFSLISCSQVPINNNDYIIGTTLETYRYGNLLFSRQPTINELKDIKKDNVKTVINLRKKSEYNEKEERDFLVNSGIKYINIPFDKLTDVYIDEVTRAVVENRKNGKVLIHCSSGNRVGIWLGGHFYKDHNYTKENALKKAKELGLTKAKAVEKVKAYLNTK
jgi:protein tyrosine phosphatase (PTP) superfamily phosphohydrolase (DUF442 family)